MTFQFDSYQLKPEQVPYAYGLALVTAMLITRSPSTVIKYASYYLMWKHFIEETRAKLPANYQPKDLLSYL